LIFGGIYLLGLLIYTIQCPERYIAGKFDYCGASHQIWHLLVLLALYITYELNWDLYYERRMHPCPL
jgi:adiponectin receptor